MKCNIIVQSLVLFGALTSIVESLPTDYEASAVDYLTQYGFLGNQDPRTGALRTEESVKDAIKDFQEFADLNITGILDDETITLMKTPRCGVVDKVGPGMLARRRKRYTIQGSSWRPKTSLTYKINRYSPDLTRAQTDDAVSRAFKVWSDVSRLNFVRRTSGRVDIDITFVARAHGDGNAFDGSGKVLAHAFFPQYGGDAHFDEDERWTVKTTRGINLFQVAAHEFGHSLGLSHSRVRSALMAPFYRGYQSNFKLDSDDVAGIRAIYGRPLSQTTTTPAPVGRTNAATTTQSNQPRPTTIPTNLCSDSKIDAITRTKDGRTYVFKGSNYYRLNDAGVDVGYPRSISQDWTGLTGPVDAALTTLGGNTYIFKGRKYWKFVNRAAQRGYPKFISQGFPGVPSNLDAVFLWSGNGEPYFIKGNQYWRYTFSRYRVSPGYPKPLASWKNLPATVDAIFQWENDRTYFFKGGNYYRFNDRDFKVDPGYPRLAADWWFGCSGPKDSQPINNNPSIHENQNNNNQYAGPVVVDSDLKDNTPSIWASQDRDGSSSSAQQTISLSLITYILTATILRLFL